MVWVKICGITSVDDAVACVQAGADAVGVNFYPRSSRYCDPDVARRIAGAVGGRAEVVGVFVDAAHDEILFRMRSSGFGLAQLHGDESPDFLERLLPHAFKALRVRGPSAIEQTRTFGGDLLLLDTFVPGVPGGTGAVFDWSIAERIARERRVILAGGLTPENVRRAVEQVRPHGVDVAGGVESAPGRKDPERVRAFIEAARVGSELGRRAR